MGRSMSNATSWHKRQALQIAAQLPEDVADARAILGHVQDLVSFFFEGPPPTSPPGQDDQAVLRFPGGSKTPRRRASSIERPSVLPK